MANKQLKYLASEIDIAIGKSLDLNIINNLTSGGINEVLSAEQGKILNTQLNKASETILTVDNKTNTINSEVEKIKENISNINSDLNNKAEKIEVASNTSKITEVTTQLETVKQTVIDCCTYGASPTLSDNTSIIQKCLDMKGHIVISKPGIYVVTGLMIDNDTAFKLYDGVELKLKDNTKQYIIRNKYANDGTTTRNKNIKISGYFNQNGQNGNGIAGGIKEKLYNGHSLFFHKVDGLDIEKVKVKDSIKYAIFIVDSTRINVKDINFDTLSDGVHFQPPINNLVVKNITGTTHDDMVAFTLGDYISHSLSNEGNFENVIIDGVNASGSLCILKITGSGKNSAYSFKNFDIRNLYGETSSSVIKITDDTVEGNTDLINTKVYNFNFENVYARSKLAHDIYIGATDGDISFRNVPYRSLIDTKAVFRVEKNLKKLKIEGIVGYDTDIQGIYLNTSDSTVIDNLILNDINVSNNRKSFISHYGIINTLTINNIIMSAKNNKNGAFMYYAKERNPIVQKVLVNNFSISDLGSIFITKTPLDLYFSNGVQNGNNVRLHFYNEYLANFEKTSVSLNAVDGDFTPTWLSNSGAKFRINMTSGTYNKELSSLTPNLFDQVICVNGNEAKRGVNIKNNTGWINIIPYSS